MVSIARVHAAENRHRDIDAGSWRNRGGEPEIADAVGSVERRHRQDFHRRAAGIVEHDRGVAGSNLIDLANILRFDRKLRMDKRGDQRQQDSQYGFQHNQTPGKQNDRAILAGMARHSLNSWA